MKGIDNALMEGTERWVGRGLLEELPCRMAKSLEELPCRMAKSNFDRLAIFKATVCENLDTVGANQITPKHPASCLPPGSAGACSQRP